jgi:serine/threonine protein kinase
MPSNALMPLNDGAIFADFRIVRRLGSGGMGEVYLIQHPRLPRRNALKILSADLSADPDYRARFNREADLASTLYHPHIVGVHDRGEYNGQLWLSMDFVDGHDAARLLAERYPAGMPVDVALSIITAVASALDYAHRQGLLHRDVKPANIMLTLDDGEQRILLTDFGIARSVDDISGLTSTNMTVGTVAYSAPEQLMGEEIDGRADQYALAATAYHLLTGLQLFAHSNQAVAISRHLNADPPAVAETRPELAALDPVLAAALAKNPDQRFASCSDFARAFADQVSPTSLAIPIAPTASAPLPLGTSWVDAVVEDSGAEKVSSHHAPKVANDPAADSASGAPTQQAPVRARKARLAEADEIEPPPHQTTILPPAALVTQWVSTLVSGVLAVILGILLWGWPGPTVVVTVVLFGAYLLVSGMAQLVSCLACNPASVGCCCCSSAARRRWFLRCWSSPYSAISGWSCFRSRSASRSALSCAVVRQAFWRLATPSCRAGGGSSPSASSGSLRASSCCRYRSTRSPVLCSLWASAS